LQSFKFDDEGCLHQQLPVALPAVAGLPIITLYGTPLQAGMFPLGLYTHPRMRLLYVGFVVVNRVGIYSFDKEGRLEFLRSVPHPGLAVCWLRVNRNGTRLYTGNNGLSGTPLMTLIPLFRFMI